jgi:hypothetical protein
MFLEIVIKLDASLAQARDWSAKRV